VERELLFGLARQMAIVLRRMQTLKRLEGQLAAMTAIQEITQAVAGGIELRALTQQIADHACRLLKADSCHVLLLDERSKRFGIAASAGQMAEDMQAFLTGLMAQDLTKAAESLSPEIGSMIQDESVLVVPILDDEEVLGLIIAQRFERQSFSQEAVGLLSMFAAHASLVIERMRLQAKLLNEAILRGAMEKADELKSDFLAAVSHELRTPLTAIKGYVEMMLAGDAGEISDMQHDFLETVKRNTDRLTARIADLLDISRIEARQLSLETRPVSLQALCEQAVAALTPAIQERQIHFIQEIPPRLPDVMADPKSILQILTNLLSNAIQYNYPGGQVELKVRDYGEQVVVAVIDTGVGIPEDQQPFLFQKFYRVGSEATRQAQGTGLGLTITKSLVELQGGKIWVESAPGAGSKFYFSLPKAKR